MHNLHNVVELLTVETICLTPHEGPTCNPVVGIHKVLLEHQEEDIK